MDDIFPPGFGPGWLEKKMVARARAGDRDAALALLETAGLSLMARSMEPVVADYVAEVLLAAHEGLKDEAARPGEVLTKAFRLERRRGRPDESRTKERDSDLAVWVHLAVERGADLSGAKRRAASLFGVVNVDRVLRANSPVSVPPDAMDYWESHFKEQRKPLPPPRR
jgi:hypothetical protein